MTETPLTDSQQVHAELLAHLHAGGRVAIGTCTRVTVYQPRHAGLFRPSRVATDRGVYVQHGRRWVYVLPETIRLHD